MAMSTLESITAEAQTNAALARSAMLSAQSSADPRRHPVRPNILASNANTLAASVANDSQTVADTANAVAAKGESAIATIDSTVQAVKDKAEAATTVLPSTGTTEGTTDTGTTEETTEEPGKDSTPAKAKKATVKGA